LIKISDDETIFYNKFDVMAVHKQEWNDKNVLMMVAEKAKK
jgi:hypothetical protein